MSVSLEAEADERGARPTQHETRAGIPHVAHAIRDAILTAERPVILTHANPDADAVGSALSVAALCRQLGRPARLVTAGDHVVPDNLLFLHDATTLTRQDDAAIVSSDLVIFVDCSDASRLGPLFYRLQTEFERHRDTVNVDHHVTNHRFGSINLVVPSAGATSEIIVGMYDALNVEILPDVATALLAGIYGDTLGLRTPSTTPDTLRASAELIEAGADLDTVVDQIFRLKPYSTICLWSEALGRTEWRGSLIWTAIYPDMLERSGATRAEGEGIVNFLAGAIGARAAVLLYEESWGWRASLRTLADDVDVAELAQQFGGGGHPRAAGCRVPKGEAERERFLDAIAQQLGPREDRPHHVVAADDPI
jgi:phosphoesterase RecJ-like protein